MGYSGDAGNALRNPSWDANGQMFSTADNANDACGASWNCAAGDGGAWWFACCSQSKLNCDGICAWSEAAAADVTDSRMLIKLF